MRFRWVADKMERQICHIRVGSSILERRIVGWGCGGGGGEWGHLEPLDKVWGLPKGRFGKGVKPLFHYNTKPLVLGVRVGPYSQCETLHWRYQHVGISKALPSQRKP